jgi:hypothetical protein
MVKSVKYPHMEAKLYQFIMKNQRKRLICSIIGDAAVQRL